MSVSKNEKKAIIINFVCAALASAIVNFVLQFVLYPSIERTVGEEKYGTVLSFVTLGIVCGLSIGGAANTVYLKSRQKYNAKQGDFFVSLCILSAIACAVCIFFTVKYATGPVEIVFVLVFVLLSIFKDYSYVDFQLKNDYPHYLLYSVIISLGYCVSVPFISKTQNWSFLLIGPSLGLIYVLLRGNVYKHPFQTSEHFKDSFKSTVTLSGSNLINYATQNLDRLILLPLVNGTAVSYYYVASLISKTLSMITGPVNNLLISYLTRSNKKLSRIVFLKINIIVAFAGAVFYIVCIVLSPKILSISFLYPELTPKIAGIIPAASLSQVLVICSSVVVALDIIVAPEKYQMYIQTVYAVTFLALAFILTKTMKLNGFIIAANVSAAIRYAVSLIIGWLYTKNQGVINETDR